MREKEEREGLGKGVGGETSRARPNGFVRRLDQETTSYFITNFPEEATATELWSKFGRFARVGEVYIPNKLDKQGRRFGFVKFRDVKDAVELLRKISNIWLGSFKIRVNLSKFNKNSQPPQGEEDSGKEGKLKQPVTVERVMQKDFSFKTALVGEAKSAVVWEVEEESVISQKLGGAYVGFLTEDKDPNILQDNFRMEGRTGFKVSALGFRKVLLWSDKAEEVKEVVESMGWWWSLFERMIPWSPELISNDRVTWLRCYGVPVHAWGNDLFRALAFKFGRFVEVDEPTKSLERCDVARVKVVSAEKKLIDSSLTVSVKGRQFGIRIIEEAGTEEGTMFRRGEVDGTIREDDNSSKCSFGGGGASVVAAVEGFSESGSDADVSDSYEVLLGLEKRGEEGRQSGGSLDRVISVQNVESEGISNNSGNTGELVEKRVNFEVGKGEKPRVLESADVDRFLEHETVKSTSRAGQLVDTDKGMLVGNMETEVEGTMVIESPESEFGPAHTSLVGSVINSKEGERRKGGVLRRMWRKRG
jgi:hypothetical protein